MGHLLGEGVVPLHAMLLLARVDYGSVAILDSLAARIERAARQTCLHLRRNRLVVRLLARAVCLALDILSVRERKTGDVPSALSVAADPLGGGLRGRCCCHTGIGRAAQATLCLQLSDCVVLNLDQMVALQDDLLELCDLIIE